MVFEVVDGEVYLLLLLLGTRFGFLALTGSRYDSMHFASAEALVGSRP